MTEAASFPELEAYDIKNIEIDNEKSFLIAVARGPDEIDQKRQIIQQVNGKYPIEEIFIAGRSLLVETNGLEVYQSPRTSRSARSQALYLFKSEYNSPAVQGYYLREGDQTSYHKHTGHTEEIRLIEGSALAIIDGKWDSLANSQNLDFEVGHMFEGRLGGAIIVCITYGEGDCFDMADHHYLPNP